MSFFFLSFDFAFSCTASFSASDLQYVAFRIPAAWISRFRRFWYSNWSADSRRAARRICSLFVLGLIESAASRVMEFGVEVGFGMEWEATNVVSDDSPSRLTAFLIDSSA